MTDSQKAVQAFLANGGKVQQIKEGVISNKDDTLSGCKCGCSGNYTDHSMRLGERGIY